MNTKLKPLLKELEKTRETYWNITPKVGRFLNQLIRDRNYQNILEIGTSNGYSALWMAEALTHTGGNLYTLESHKKDRYQLAKTNFEKSGLHNITLILGHAPEALPKEPESFDMAFFDATKSEHPDFFNSLKNRINPSGLIITDNINSHSKELQPYIDLLESTSGWFSIKLSLGTGLLLSLRQ